ncbi:MAG: DsrE family protein [Bacteroidales bacterium]|nr:DsrE family protein [Bacteroidales bacterium]
MKTPLNQLLIAGICLLLAPSCKTGTESLPVETASDTTQITDGILIHVSHGTEDPHRVLMALKMADIMSENHDVIMYFDINGVEVVLTATPDIEHAEFPNSGELLTKLINKNIPIMVCPTCLKVAGKTKEDVRKGVMIAQKEKFFSFTKGRIVTIDY